MKRNILYESRCGTCEDKKGGECKIKRMKRNETKVKGKNIYVGETSRSLYERCNMSAMELREQLTVI